MREYWLPLLVLVVWIALNRWILPALGVPTCMSGGCAASRCPLDGAGSAEGRDRDGSGAHAETH